MLSLKADDFDDNFKKNQISEIQHDRYERVLLVMDYTLKLLELEIQFRTCNQLFSSFRLVTP